MTLQIQRANQLRKEVLEKNKAKKRIFFEVTLFFWNAVSCIHCTAEGVQGAISQWY